MSDNNFGEIIQPIHYRVSASADKTKIALTFQCPDRTPLTLMLPLAGGAALQRNLAQVVYILTAKPPAQADVPVEQPVAAE
jgi:hypothetical protein